MTEKDLSLLNNEQLEALKQTQGAVLVTAGAGSGKTRLLTNRIVFLIENLGVSPENILAITFTNKAAGEMKERVVAMTEKGDRVWISTFHSMCAKILRLNINKLDVRFNSNFSIYSDNDTDKVLKNIFTKKDIIDENFKKTVKFHISNFKNNNYKYESYIQDFAFEKDIELIVSIIKEYQTNLVENNALDFDDLLVQTYKLLYCNKEVLEYYANRFQYVLVDEFQDTNIIQYDLVKLLCSKHKNIFVVGDEDQCIYTWRGANFKNISNFKKDFENVKVYKLERNYRSTKIILDCANKLIKNNKSRIDKTLWSDIDGAYPIERKELYDEQAEADYVSNTIHYLVNNCGYEYKDFAILLRLNALTFQFEEKLLSYNIPHKVFGGFKFYDRVEVKNVLSYLKVFINPKDEQAFLRVINFPKRGIGDSAIAKIREIAEREQTYLLDICLKINNFELPNSITNKINSFSEIYKKLYAEYELTPLNEFAENIVKYFSIKSAYPNKTEEDMDKMLNIDQLLYSIQTYATKNPQDTLNDYLQSVSLISDIDTLDETNNAIVATVHSVKGLEFKCVFLVGLEEKIFPISRSFGNEEQMEEERRLLYVGITRAKERLFFCNCKTRFLYGHRDYMMPSRFLGELGYTNKGATISVANNTTTRKTNAQVDFVKSAINTSTYNQFLNQNKPKIDINLYHKGDSVLHTKFGIGKILDIDFESKTADIDFNDIGVKTLMLEIAPLKKL
ncbi:MAG: UvrD-helicase domain-containing protein [Clostridia bacterium]|nr:UvrD-helicase domain-containing protein [Clostridia bacterium]